MSITSLPNGYVYVPRPDWGGGQLTAKRMNPGRRTVAVHHDVIPPVADPCEAARRTAGVLAARKLDGYNWLVHPSGVVLELMGDRIGQHTEGHNSLVAGLCFMGNLDRQPLTLAALVAAARTINLGRLSGLLAADVAVEPHQHFKATACPGANLTQRNLVDLNGRPCSGLDWLRFLVAGGV